MAQKIWKVMLDWFDYASYSTGGHESASHVFSTRKKAEAWVKRFLEDSLKQEQIDEFLGWDQEELTEYIELFQENMEKDDIEGASAAFNYIMELVEDDEQRKIEIEEDTVS